MFWEVSIPSSPHYRQFATPEQISALVAPAPQSIYAVKSFLREWGVSGQQMKLNPSRDFLIAHDLDPVLVSQALACRWTLMAHPATSQRAQVCRGGFTLPHAVSEAVDFVGGLDYYPSKWMPPLTPDRVAVSSKGI